MSRKSGLDAFRAVKGLFPWNEGDELPEETIRRMRDGMPSQQQFTNFARLIRAAVVEIAFRNKYITEDDCIRLLTAPIRKGVAYDDSGLLYYFDRESLERTIEAIGNMPEIDIEKLKDYLTDD